MPNLPAFTLTDTAGHRRRFPSGRLTLLAFMKADCPTCVTSLPLVDALSAAVPAPADVWIIAQDADGGRALAAHGGGNRAALDDSALAVSYAFGVEIVPTVMLIDGDGTVRRSFEGFDKSDWQALTADLAALAHGPLPSIDWTTYPDRRPGCGSRTLDPALADRLAAEAEGSPLRARRIEIAAHDDPFEFLFDQGLTDGLPVVPPTPERVLRMLAATRRDAQDVVAIVPPNLAPATVEKVAINAVMAGCKPEYLPVVLAAVEAVCTDEFNIHGVLATTYFPTPVLIVNGPIRDRIGMNYRGNVLGQGNRANATIGRAVQLVIRNVGGGRPGEVDRATIGHPGKFTCCFAEWEERSPWDPLHVERGFARDDSVVTVYAGGAPTGFIDQLSRDGRSLATSYGRTLAAVTHPNLCFHGEIVVVVPPEHVDTFARDGWTKRRIRERILEVTTRPAAAWRGDAECAEGIPAAFADNLPPDMPLAKFMSAEAITIVVAGGEAGKFGAFLQPWLSGPMGSVMVSRKIDTTGR